MRLAANNWTTVCTKIIPSAALSLQFNTLTMPRNKKHGTTTVVLITASNVNLITLC